MENLYHHIAWLAQQHPTKEALLVCNHEGDIEKIYTFQELQQEIDKIGCWLNQEFSLKPGDALGLAIPNSAEFLLMSFAAWAAGIITVPLNLRRDTIEQYEYKLNLTNAKVKISEQNLASLSAFHAVGSPSWAPGVSHTALILFTSGTTAAPKGVELTLENLLINAQGIKDWLQITDQDRFLVLLPLYHVNSTTFCLASLLAGASIAIVPRYSNTKFWQQLAKTQSTFTSIVPTICFDQLSQTDEFSKVRTELKINRIQIGSAPVVVNDVQKFLEQFAIPLYQGYGQTETALRVTGVPLDLPKDLYAKLIQDNSIGKPMSWADVQIMDTQGNVLGEGQEGELAVKGPAVMKGYIENPEANKDAFSAKGGSPPKADAPLEHASGGKNSYFLTGDLGYYKLINGTRYFFLKGRIKEIIIKGGVNISPVAIEEKLREVHPAMSQVFVIGVPDRRYGEEVAAVVCWNQNENSISRLEAEFKNRLCGGLPNLTSFEKPQYIFSIAESEIPRTATGKVQRSLLKERLPLERFQLVNLVAGNKDFRFLRLRTSDTSYLQQAFEVLQRCWHPLLLDQDTFAAEVEKGVVIMGVDKDNKVQGLITLFQTGLGEKELTQTNYHTLRENLLAQTNVSNGDKIVCISICVASYQPDKTPQDGSIKSKSIQEMQDYLALGADHMFNFHKKSKAGLPGAQLLALLPNSRPEDTMSLGYNMLMKYPLIPATPAVEPNGDASLSVQLIEAAMAFAQQLGISEVYALSRPAGAYQYFSSKK